MTAPDPFPFDLVIFDLDGTLVATERFWTAAADAGARRAFAELGLSRPLPTAEQWMGMVGLALETAFERVFPDLDPASRARVMQRCEEAEHEALRAGGAALMPGASECLDALAARGVRLGLASNCGTPYLEHMLSALSLSRWIGEARCLGTPGMHSKADMIADLLRTFGTRSAVMVGDRATDAEAARANAIAHVHLTQGFAPRGETIDADAVLADLTRLVPRLEGRTRWIESAAERLALLRGGLSVRGGVTSLGVTGAPAAGKGLFARDLARLLEARGRPARVVSLAGYTLEDAPAGDAHGLDAEVDVLRWVERRYDLERLIAECLEPLRAGLPGRDAAGLPIAPGTLAIVEGPYLAHPRLRLALDRLLHLELAEPLALTRVACRDGVDALARLRRTELAPWRSFEQAFPAARRADLCLAAGNPLGPEEV